MKPLREINPPMPCGHNPVFDRPHGCTACRVREAMPDVRAAIRARLVALVDQALAQTKQGENVYGTLARLLVVDAIESNEVD